MAEGDVADGEVAGTGEPARQAPGRTPLVLVVDDSPQIRQLISVNLQLEGFEVVEAVDGLEALAALERIAPDVITIDARMPRLDGFETVRRLRADPRFHRLPVIMVTASTQELDRSRAVEATVDAFIEKPFDPDRLVAQVRALVAAS